MSARNKKFAQPTLASTIPWIALLRIQSRYFGYPFHCVNNHLWNVQSPNQLSQLWHQQMGTDSPHNMVRAKTQFSSVAKRIVRKMGISSFLHTVKTRESFDSELRSAKVSLPAAETATLEDLPLREATLCCKKYSAAWSPLDWLRKRENRRQVALLADSGNMLSGNSDCKLCEWCRFPHFRIKRPFQDCSCTIS